MKTLEELHKIKARAKEDMALRQKEARCTVKVAMGTCGIAAGARPVMAAILDELEKRQVTDVLVTNSGCTGYCDQEPLVEVIGEDGKRVVYGKVEPADARRIVAEHVIKNKVLDDMVFVMQ
ncbi:(2Fe-2S) ferredoxin domain-containing protein [bacterium]|nr:(2Fe-2S) ferredoxin domain-containing protein [bacterium]